MNLFELLKQFKRIEPDPAFTETSKRAILAFDPARRPEWNVRQVFIRIVETGAAVALTGFFVLLITSALSGSRLTPQYSAIDTQSLRAEAQAIDIQIQLANLNYNPPSAESTAPTALGKPSGAANTVSPASTTAPTATSSETSTVSIDEALRSLTK